MNFKFLRIGYFLTVFSLFLYSFTQVDLSLTLSQWSIWQVLQKFFQNIGYFQRPLSTIFYLVIILFLFVFYSLFLYLAIKNKINKKQIWSLIIISSLILFLSYNAFSYDLFNYIFDAKIVTFYHQNPYFHKALDFPNDPMLSFMRWTHRVYPYGPTWLFLTVPLSFLGFKLLLPTIILFKSIAVISFIGTVFFIGKILQKISPKNETLGLVIFGLNPLILIESLVSAHNDIVMMFFAIFGLYLIVEKKILWAVLILIISVGVKFGTLFLAPVFFLILVLVLKKKEIIWDKILSLSIIFMITGVITVSLRTNFQPWYLVYAVPFIALIAKRYLIIPTIIISSFSLLIYVPFLYQGDWNDPIPQILFWIMLTSVNLSILYLAGFFIKTSFAKK